MRPHLIHRVPFILALLVLSLIPHEMGATTILDTGSITFTASGLQFGRLTRDGIPSDWASPKSFPGVIGAPATRAYDLFTVNAGPYPYLQVLLDDPAVALFASAYLGAYTPANAPPNFGLNVNYLGDAGFSQILDNPSFFQIVVNPFANVLIPINEVNPGGGAGAQFSLLVEGFYDTNYSETPEPASLALVATGAALLAAIRRRTRSV